jgi:hypothetical protein
MAGWRDVACQLRSSTIAARGCTATITALQHDDHQYGATSTGADLPPYPFDPEWFACGASSKKSALILIGVVGWRQNTGYGFNSGCAGEPVAVGLDSPSTIQVTNWMVTVGSTLRHTLASFYFSSMFYRRWPAKTDLIFLRVTSSRAGTIRDKILAKLQVTGRSATEDSGTYGGCVIGRHCGISSIGASSSAIRRSFHPHSPRRQRSGRASFSGSGPIDATSDSVRL